MLNALTAEICRFVRDWPEHLPGNHPYFDEPVIGVASGHDPIFDEYRRVIGPFHWTPLALATASFPGQADGPLSVVCWVLPISRHVRVSNRGETIFPSREWALTRSLGETLNVALRRHITAWLSEHGISAMAPQLAEGWHQLDDERVGIASSWSERHAAYAAGLGTFSLNDGLITSRGIAHRLGSVVAAADLPVTPRNSGIRDNCLYYSRGICGICIQRCPAEALSTEGHDKNRCREHVYGTAPREVGHVYGVPHTGCGLCQTAVPCESGNPCLPSPKV